MYSAAESSSDDGIAVTETGSDMAIHYQIVEECRQHMVQSGKEQLLLSMLGVALSPSSRQHLKKAGLGLKYFLAQHPSEFSIDGPKGREFVLYLPVNPQHPGAQRK